MFSKIGAIKFPEPQNISTNMMPIVVGNKKSLPNFVSQYQDIIDAANFVEGDIVYLTINEQIVEQGMTQRRAGQHTDATSAGKHGGHGGRAGIYIASTDGDCQAWQARIHDVNEHGSLNIFCKDPATKFDASTLYRMDDTTPHESLPASTTHYRQFFRLTGPELGFWWAEHNTANPLGVLPNAKVRLDSKFQR